MHGVPQKLQEYLHLQILAPQIPELVNYLEVEVGSSRNASFSVKLRTKT